MRPWCTSRLLAMFGTSTLTTHSNPQEDPEEGCSLERKVSKDQPTIKVMSEEPNNRLDPHSAKRTPSKGDVLSRSEVYPGSGFKRRSRQSLRTPQQHIPLGVDDRQKNRRASRSFVLLDQSDKDTPRTHIEAFMEVAQTARKAQSSSYIPSATKRRSLHTVTGEEISRRVFKSPRVRELAGAGSSGKARASSPGSQFTPRTNIWNLLQAGEEQSPVNRTEYLSETKSTPAVQSLTTSVQNAGQRVSVSPLNLTSLGTAGRSFGAQSSASRRAKRRSFHLNSSHPDSVQHSGQRVSVSPINVSDNRVETDEFTQPKSKRARRSFHFDAPQSEEMEQPQDFDADSGENFDVEREQFEDLDIEKEQPENLNVEEEQPEKLDVEEEQPENLDVDNGEDLDDGEEQPENLDDVEEQPRNLDVDNGEDLDVVRERPENVDNGEDLDVEREQPENFDVYNVDTQERAETSNRGYISGQEGGQMGKSAEKSQIQSKGEIEEDGGLSKELSKSDNLNSRGLDHFRSQRQEKVLDIAALRPEKDISNKDEAAAVADPANIYDLSEGSSASREENSVSVASRSRRSSSRQKFSSERRRTLGRTSLNKSAFTPVASDENPGSSSRKRLEFSVHQRPSVQTVVGSPEQVETLQDQPRSSTPINRSRRFFHSTKIQRSVTDYFQEDQDAASTSAAMTPKIRNLFSDISPIRALALERADAENDRAAGDGVQNGKGEPSNQQASTSKRASRLTEDNAAISQSSDGELPSFSTLATPHIDLRKRVVMSSLQRKPLSVSRSKSEKIQRQVPKVTKTKITAKQITKPVVRNLPRRTIKYFAELHSDMKLSKDAIEEIEKVSEQFWMDTFNALEAYALHAGRKTIQDADVILLMKTQGLITGTEDLHNKIRQLMPMEIRKELIPCAYRPLKHK